MAPERKGYNITFASRKPRSPSRASIYQEDRPLLKAIASVMSSKCSYKTARGTRSSNSHSAKHPEALPLDGEGLGGGDVPQIAARDVQVSEIWSIRKRRNEHEDLFEAKNRLAGIGCPSLRRLCSGTVTLPHRGGGLLRARYVTAIERNCTGAVAPLLRPIPRNERAPLRNREPGLDLCKRKGRRAESARSRAQCKPRRREDRVGSTPDAALRRGGRV
jgi:hypothetical protein